MATAVSVLGAVGLVACGYHYLTDTVGAALLATALVGVAAQLARVQHAGRVIAVLAMLVAAPAGGLCIDGIGAPGFAAPGSGPEPSAAARAAGLVDVRSAVPDAIVDLRYATPDNFVGTPLYPPDARCLVHESLAPGLAAAADVLRRQGRTLVFWDCYRPHAVQVRMLEAVPDPNWVARPGPFARSHEAGRSVDVTMADGGDPADMGTGFDDFSPRALAFTTQGISEAAVANRAELRNAMSAGGLAPYPGEWWHFDGPGAGVQRPVLDVPVN